MLQNEFKTLFHKQYSVVVQIARAEEGWFLFGVGVAAVATHPLKERGELVPTFLGFRGRTRHGQIRNGVRNRLCPNNLPKTCIALVANHEFTERVIQRLLSQFNPKPEVRSCTAESGNIPLVAWVYAIALYKWLTITLFLLGRIFGGSRQIDTRFLFFGSGGRHTVGNLIHEEVSSFFDGSRVFLC